MTLSLEEIRRRLADRNLSKVAEGCGVHYQTIVRLARGYIVSPTPRTIEEISAYLTRDERAGAEIREAGDK